MAENGEPLIAREPGIGRGGGGGRRGGGLRLRRQAQGEVVEREGEVRQLAALADENHWLVGLLRQLWGEEEELPRELR